ncbi:hypothetical protein ACELLULO517_07685 [Acidisoma cellulosilytica]|uniref:Terminase small subunit n=1 Tax=Acidisoma cellulosilyticum TaxID=2802395 RepID=A0A964E3B8_9PROT|nr:hypothetical protein [Acidisoma cellulosilyticum]MCB8880112.1 hypothetical protein [Acidisoma cellulosilyticum]
MTKSPAKTEGRAKAKAPTPRAANKTRAAAVKRKVVDQFTQEFADEFCRLIREDHTIREIIAMPGMPSWSTIHGWMRRHASFKQDYLLARDASADIVEAKIIEISKTAKDKDSAAAARVQTSALQWVAGKRSARYGERVHHDLQHLDRNGNPADPQAVDIASLAMDKLTTAELKMLIYLYRKMGVILPHEPPPETIEHDSAGEVPALDEPHGDEDNDDD